MKRIILALLLITSCTFGQITEQQLDSVRIWYTQKLEERRVLDASIQIQRDKIDSLRIEIEAGLMEAERLRKRQDSIQALKATMLRYKRQIDSLNQVNEQLAREQLALPPFYEVNNTPLHIDFVQFLEETGEYALSLEFLPKADMNVWYDSAQSGGYEMNYTNDPEYVRYRIPEEEIKRYFYTDRLADVLLYDKNNRFLGRGIFQGYEFISQNIEPKTVAVFRMEKLSGDTAFYAVGGISDTLPAIAPKHYTNSETYVDLQARLWPENYTTYHGSEVTLDDFRWMILQGYPFERGDEQEFETQVRADLYLEHDGGIKRVHQLKKGWLYWHLQPLPMNYKNYPIILLEKAMVESDWFMQAILIWNGEAYEERPVRFNVGE